MQKAFVALIIGVAFSCSNHNAAEQKGVGTDSSKGLPTEIPISDSGELTRIHSLFYRNKDGGLFMRTTALREGPDGHLHDVEYFNGMLPQDIDPLTFEVLDGWYAKDANFAYTYHPESGGIRINKINGIDVRSSKVLEGHYLYAVDKNRFYSFFPSAVDSLKPKKTKMERDTTGRIVAFVSGGRTYPVE